MKRLGLAGLVAVLALGLVGEAIAAPPHKLRSYEARSAAESAAFEFQMRHKLDSSSVGKCKRKALRRFVCSASASGEKSRLMKTCDLRIEVRARYAGFYWTERASVVGHRCSSEEMPFLTYGAALRAIQAEADRFAGQPTRITYMSRQDDVTFSGRAEWTRPRVPPSEFLPTENCSVSLVATLTAGTMAVTNDGFSCY